MKEPIDEKELYKAIASMSSDQREGEDSFFLPFDEERNHNQEDFTLAEVLSAKGKSIELEYDFGDGWLHDVKLSSIADYLDGEPRIVRFIKGALVRL